MDLMTVREIGGDPDREWARWALECWAEFPVHDNPRPLVFVGPLVLVQLGFRSGAAKLAFGMGAIDGDESVPTQVLDLLRTEGSLVATHKDDSRVLVHNARREVGEFVTDRGRRQLEAWHLESDDVNGPIIVVDPGVAALRWKPPDAPGRPRPYPGSPHRAHGTTVGGDGQSLTFNFVGSPENVVDYPSAEVFESERAVAVVPIRAYREPFGPGTAVRAVGVSRSVLVQLAAPLGARVLTDLDGSPVVVAAGAP